MRFGQRRGSPPDLRAKGKRGVPVHPGRPLRFPGSSPRSARQIRPGPATLFRLQGTADARLAAYLAEGEFLDIPPRSFGSIGFA